MSINPIIAALGGPNPKNPQPPRNNNPLAMLGEFMKFKKSFTGDPQAVLSELLSSGKMSKEQLAELKSEAEGLLEFLK